MADQNDNRQQRWTSAGYWVERREGARSERRRESARHEDEREKQRRYGRRAVDQGERMYNIYREDRQPWDEPPEMGRSARPYPPRQRGNSYPQENRYAQEPQRSRRSVYPGGDFADRENPSNDYDDNYWGLREQRRDYQIRHPGAWWNTTGGRHDYTDARRPDDNDLLREQRFDDIDERDYSWDPGFDYEFGTDFDFLNDVNRDTVYQEEARRSEPRTGRRSEPRTGRRAEQRPTRQNQPAQQDRGTWEGFDYGWTGEPYRQKAVYREFWNVPGPYQGAGPKGYQRSDARIKEEISEVMTAHGRIDPSDVTLAVDQGTVSLSGTVNRREEKYLAEDIAASISGVKDVQNHIQVNRRRF